MISIELINNEFKRLNLIEKSKNHIKEKLLTDEEIINELFESKSFIDNKQDCFQLQTIGVDVFQAEPEFLRYKLSYEVILENEWIKNYYLFFDEFGNYLDDFFDMQIMFGILDKLRDWIKDIFIGIIQGHLEAVFIDRT